MSVWDKNPELGSLNCMVLSYVFLERGKFLFIRDHPWHFCWDRLATIFFSFLTGYLMRL